MGMMPSNMASLMALFNAPTCRQGGRLNVFIISSPLTGAEIADTVVLPSFSFWHQLEVVQKRCLRSMFLEVIGLAQRHKVVYIVSPQTANGGRRSRSHIVRYHDGTHVQPHQFLHIFHLLVHGSFILRKMSGIIFSPMKLWLWNVHPARGSQRLVIGLAISCSRAMPNAAFRGYRSLLMLLEH